MATALPRWPGLYGEVIRLWKEEWVPPPTWYFLCKHRRRVGREVRTPPLERAVSGAAGVEKAKGTAKTISREVSGLPPPQFSPPALLSFLYKTVAAPSATSTSGCRARPPRPAASPPSSRASSRPDSRARCRLETGRRMGAGFFLRPTPPSPPGCGSRTALSW